MDGAWAKTILAIAISGLGAAVWITQLALIAC